MLSVQVSSSVAPFSGTSPLEFAWYASPVFLCYCFPLKLSTVFFCLLPQNFQTYFYPHVSQSLILNKCHTVKLPLNDSSICES